MSPPLPTAAAAKSGNTTKRHRSAAAGGKLLSLCVICSGALAWYSFGVSGLYDPRSLTADHSQESTRGSSSSNTSISISISSSSIAISSRNRTDSSLATLWNSAASLWGGDPTVSQWTLQEDLVSGLGIWQRLVYLEGNVTWINQPPRDNRHPAAPASIYPHVVRPGMERGVYEDDDAATGDMVDLTRFYPQIDSADERFHMERNIWPVHEVDPVHCRPMQAWQSTSFPVCNTIHEADLRSSLPRWPLISRKGFWRQAWRSEDRNGEEDNTTRPVVWKTFK
jgi:hypothetical protein